MKGDDIAERLLVFAVRIIKMSGVLSKSQPGKHVCGQVVRSSTSAGANYEEARGAESNRDFVHKLSICLKELRETQYWLKIIGRAELASPDQMNGITQEADELCRIIGKSIVTAKKKTNQCKS